MSTQDPTKSVLKGNLNSPNLVSGNGFIANLVNSMARPFVQTGQNIGGAVYEANRAGLTSRGVPNLYVDPNTGKDIQDPFLPDTSTWQENNPGKQVGHQLANTAAIASYAVPFGKGANIATRALIPGAAVGAAQSLPEAKNPEDVIKGAAMGAVIPGAMDLAGQAISKVAGKGLEDTANLFRRGQYNLSPTQAAKVDANQTVADLARFGLKTPKQVKFAAEALTGEDGLLNKMVENGVSKASPVNLGEITAPSGINLPGKSGTMITGTAVQKPSILESVTEMFNTPEAGLIPENMAEKNLKIIQSSLDKASHGTLNGAEPLSVLRTQRNLESAGYAYMRSSNTVDRQLGRIYLNTADLLEDRLYNVSGADTVGLPGVLTPENISKIAEVSPQIAQDASKAQSLGDLRSLQKSLVRGSQMVDMSGAKTGNSPINLKKIFEIGIALHSPAGALLAGADTDFGKNLIANTLDKFAPVAGASASINPNISGQISARIPGLTTLNSPNENQNQNQDNLNHGDILPLNGKVAPKYAQPVLPGGFLTGKDHIDQVNSLTQQIQDVQMSDPQKANELTGQLKQIENSWNTQQPIRDAWTETNQTNVRASSAYNLIQKADPTLLNLNGSFDKLLNSADPKYAALGVALQSIQNLTGVRLDDKKTKQALEAALDQAIEASNQKYDSLTKQFFGGSSTQNNLPPVQPIPVTPAPQEAPQSLPAGMLQGGYQTGRGLPSTPPAFPQ